MPNLLEDEREKAAINQPTLYVGFGGCQVAVQANAPEVLAGIQCSFLEMLSSEPTKTVGWLEVEKKDGKYHLLGNIEAPIEGDSLANILHCLNHEVVRQLIQARPDLLWFHAGAAVYGGSAVVLPGAWGRGKSTLVTNLYARGWTYLSDDIVPIDLNSGKVIPFPKTPKVRQGPGRQMPRHHLRELKRAVVYLDPKTVCRETIPIGALVFPTYNLLAPTELLPYSPATAALELLQSCLNFANHRQAAVRYLCELLKGLPAFRLSFNDGNLASELIVEAYEKGF